MDSQHIQQFIRASRTNCQPAESSGMYGKGANPQEQVPCPKCWKKVQRRYLRKHKRSQHQGVRRRRHACPYCTAEICKTYSTLISVAFRTVPRGTSIWPGLADGTHRALGARECRVVASPVGSCWNQERDRPDLSPQSQRFLRERRERPQGRLGTRMQRR